MNLLFPIVLLILMYACIAFMTSLFILNAGTRRAAPNDELWEILASVFWPLTVILLLAFYILVSIRRTFRRLTK